MESRLHRQLKQMYAIDGSATETRVGTYRIDTMHGDRLVEIQQSSLAQIRRKLQVLLCQHDVLVVKPLIVRRYIQMHLKRGGELLYQRWSGKRGRLIDVFNELIYFTRTFPHPRLVMHIPLIEIVEQRYRTAPSRRWRAKTYRVENRDLIAVHDIIELKSAADLHRLLPHRLPSEFDTAQIAAVQQVPRWIAQRIAYCLYHSGAVEYVGKNGKSRRYACR